MARISIALLTFVMATSPLAAQVRQPIRPQDGDLILVDGNTRVRVVRRTDAQVRTIYHAAQRKLVVIADYAFDGAQPDGRVDVTFTFDAVEGEWPLGERWEGRATLDDYSVAAESGHPGIGLTTPGGLIQILSGPRSARDARAFTDPTALANMTSDAKVLRGISLLNDAALAAARQWRYQPTMLNGAAVPVIVTATVAFK